MLTELGMTLEEWGATDVVHQRFYRSGHNEKMRRQEKANRNAG